MQRDVGANATFQTVYARKAIKAKQVGIGKLKIEAVFIRVLLELAVADLRSNDDFSHRLDDLGSPRARVTHERPTKVDSRLRQRARRVHLAYRAKVRLLVERTCIVADGVI